MKQGCHRSGLLIQVEAQENPSKISCLMKMDLELVWLGGVEPERKEEGIVNLVKNGN